MLRRSKTKKPTPETLRRRIERSSTADLYDAADDAISWFGVMLTAHRRGSEDALDDASLYAEGLLEIVDELRRRGKQR